MSKENEEEVVENIEDIVETQDDDGNDTTDWKALAQENQEFAKKNQGIAKRYKTKYTKLKKEPDPVIETKPDPKEKKSDPSELDYAKKAYLVANGIKGSKETELIQKVLSESGKTVDEVLESKYFQAELNELRELNKTDDALPKGSKRTGQSAQDTVDYWIAKGELPTDRKLRQDVVNARIAKETNKSVFE